MTDPKLILNQVDIVARDFEASVAFYRALGVDIPELPSYGEIQHADVTLPNGFILHIDNETLARTYNAAWRAPGGSSRALLGFAVATRAEVDERYAALVAAGYEGRQPPYDTFWGARYAIVADPDGNDVGIMSPLDDSKRSWPPVESPSR